MIDPMDLSDVEARAILLHFASYHKDEYAAEVARVTAITRKDA